MQHVGNRIIKYSYMFDYCSTCHSTQGASMHGKACIFDYKHKLATWGWLWTALIENGYCYRYDNDKDDNFIVIYYVHMLTTN